jgi:hypothetical protein
MAGMADRDPARAPSNRRADDTWLGVQKIIDWTWALPVWVTVVGLLCGAVASGLRLAGHRVFQARQRRIYLACHTFNLRNHILPVLAIEA